MTIAGSSWFYHEHSRRLIVAFGKLFEGIAIVRRNQDGTTKEIIESVPIENLVHDKFYERAKVQKKDDGDLASRGHKMFPRMGFGLIGMSYASGRQNSVMQRFLSDADGSTARYANTPAPYDFEFELKISARNFTDMIQIVEQIVPHFRPTHTMVLRDWPFENDHIDVPVTLNSVQWTDSAEDDLDEGSRQVIATLMFTAQYHFYGPSGSDSEIEIKHALDVKRGNEPTDPKQIVKLAKKTVIDFYTESEGFYESSNSAMRFSASKETPSSPLVIDMETPPAEGRGDE